MILVLFLFLSVSGVKGYALVDPSYIVELKDVSITGSNKTDSCPAVLVSSLISFTSCYCLTTTMVKHVVLKDPRSLKLVALRQKKNHAGVYEVTQSVPVLHFLVHPECQFHNGTRRVPDMDFGVVKSRVPFNFTDEVRPVYGNVFFVSDRFYNLPFAWSDPNYCDLMTFETPRVVARELKMLPNEACYDQFCSTEEYGFCKLGKMTASRFCGSFKSDKPMCSAADGSGVVFCGGYLYGFTSFPCLSGVKQTTVVVTDFVQIYPFYKDFIPRNPASKQTVSNFLGILCALLCVIHKI